jgi:Family of unknown function (DUF6214)
LIGVGITLVDGVYRVTDVAITGEGSEAISTDFLRQIPLRTIVRTAAGDAIRSENAGKAATVSSQGVDDLSHTAFIYRLARALGEAPTKAVMEEKGVSRSTASRLVKAAREAELLGRDEIGQAGGARSHRLEAG